VTFDEDPGRVTVERNGCRVKERLAGNNLLGSLNVGDDLLGLLYAQPLTPASARDAPM
jgi:hypothetical protein